MIPGGFESKVINFASSRESKMSKEQKLIDLHDRRLDSVESHALVLANHKPTSLASAADRLNLVKHQMAKEAASLEFNRNLRDLEGKDTSQISNRLVATLQKIAAIDLEVKKLGATFVDPKSAEVQEMVVVWVETLTEVLKELVGEGIMTSQTMDLLINKFGAALDGWEDRVAGNIEEK